MQRYSVRCHSLSRANEVIRVKQEFAAVNEFGLASRCNQPNVGPAQCCLVPPPARAGVRPARPTVTAPQGGGRLVTARERGARSVLCSSRGGSLPTARRGALESPIYPAAVNDPVGVVDAAQVHDLFGGDLRTAGGQLQS